MKSLLLPLLLVFTAIILLTKRRDPLASHADYMQAEYGRIMADERINNWIDYWEGYVTG